MTRPDWPATPDLEADADTLPSPPCPSPAALDVPALLAEAAAWDADRRQSLRAGLVTDLAEALRRATAQPPTED